MGTRRGNREGSKPRLRGDGRWTAKVSWADELGARQVTQVYGRSQAEVRRKMKEVIRRLDASEPGHDSKIVLADFVATWISTTLAASDRKPSTKAGYKGLATTHIINSTVLAGKSLDQIRPTVIEAWILELRAKGLSQSSVRQVYTILRAVLETAVRDGLLAKNAAAAIKRPRVEHREAEYLSPAQVRDLLEAAAESRYFPLFKLLVLTGMRRGEALALRWRDVNLDEGKAHIRGTLSRLEGDLTIGSTKTRASKRMIDLSDSAVAVLRQVKQRTRQERLAAGSKWTGANELVFVTEFGEPADPRNCLRALTWATKRAGIVGLEGSVGLHTLRHTAAALMLMSGEPMITVSRHLGHSSISTTADLYGHVSPDASRAAVEALEAALA